MQFEDLDKRGKFEYLPEAIFLEDFEGNILDVNNEACRLLGYSKEDLLERKVEDIVPEEQPVFMAEEIDQATQASDPIETVNLRKDGTEVPVELRGRIIEIDGEERILVSVRDISDRKRAKRKLKQSEERLQLALEGTKAGIWDWNVQTGDVVFSERWAEIVGYTLEELQPATIETWEELAHPEDLKRSEELLEEHFDGETDIYECEARMKHKNGDWVWVLDRGGVVEWNNEGEPVRMVGTHQDITERKEAEQELKNSEAKFSAIAEQAHDGIYIYRGDRFEWVNRRVSEILGYKREELTQKSVWDLIHPQDRDRVKKMTKKMMDRKEASSTYEARVLTKDGEVKHAEFAVTLIEYEGEQAILGAARDITERKRAEKELEESEEKYRTIFESAKEAIFIMKGDKFVDCNEKTLEMFECEREDIIGKPPAKFSPEKQPGGRASAEKAEEKINLALEDNPQNFEWVHTTKDGEPFHAEITLNRYMIEDEKFVMAIVRDITEKKKAKEELQESEKKYRQIFHNAHDIVTLHEQTEDGMPGQFIEVNDVACEVLGYSREELLSMKPSDIAAGDRQQDLSDIMESLRDDNQQKFEMWVEAKDGRKVLVEVSYHVFEVNGEKRVLSIARDITERKQVQQALKEGRKKLKHLHDAVDELQQQENEGSILRTAVDVSEDILDFELCAIDLIEGDYLVTKAISSDLSPDQTEKYEIGEGVSGSSVKREETIWGDDLRNHPEAKPASDEFRSFISAPIGDLGVFQVVSLEVGSFDKQDIELAEILADHLLEEIKRVRLEEDLRQQAIRDPLTGLYNRRYFNETLEEEVERCKRYDKPIAFLMADVNRFKEINDRYAHQTGDEVLKEVASLLEENVRNADTVVRYGGDEFLVMMTQTEGGVENTVKRLKDSLGRWNEESNLLDFPLSLAMGVSHWKPDQNRDVEEALKEADKKMYEDKER